MARGTALWTGRTRRGHGAAVGASGRGSLTERPPGLMTSSGALHRLVSLTAAYCACNGWLGWGLDRPRRRCRAVASGSRPLCLRAVVCCLVPPCALLALGGTLGSGMVGPYLLVGHVSVLAGAPRSTVGRCPVVFGRVCLAAAPCDSKAAVASALVPRRALNSSALGPRVRLACAS